MSTWDGKTRGGLAGYRIFIYILKTLGLRPAYFLLRFVAFYYFLFSRKSNRHLAFYFRKVLGHGKWRSKKSTYQNYFLLGQVLIDKVAVMAGMGKYFTYHWDGEENLHNMNEGGLLISAHIGSWEIAGNFLHRINRRFNIVMFDKEHQKIKDYLEEVMTEKNLHAIPIKNDLTHVMAIKNALEAQELVAMHADRFLEGSKTISQSLLGHEAKFPEGPFYLAARFRTPVTFVFAVKESRRHYHFFATKAKTYDTGPLRAIQEEQLMPIIKDYICEMEAIIGKYPLQWFNYHKFWDEEVGS